MFYPRYKYILWKCRTFTTLRLKYTSAFSLCTSITIIFLISISSLLQKKIVWRAGKSRSYIKWFSCKLKHIIITFFMTMSNISSRFPHNNLALVRPGLSVISLYALTPCNAKRKLTIHNFFVFLGPRSSDINVRNVRNVKRLSIQPENECFIVDHYIHTKNLLYRNIFLISLYFPFGRWTELCESAEPLRCKITPTLRYCP
jgi:hypothetical protein